MPLDHKLVGDIAVYVKNSQEHMQKQAQVIEYYKKKELANREKVAQVVRSRTDVQDYLKEPLIQSLCEDPVKFANFVADKNAPIRPPIGSRYQSGTSNINENSDPFTQWVLSDD